MDDPASDLSELALSHRPLDFDADGTLSMICKTSQPDGKTELLP